jgi:ubiquinone/menaquinone biosynthesis C-methylase UbiE
LLRQSASPSGAHILEVGCGVGLFEKELHQDAAIRQITAIDPEWAETDAGDGRDPKVCFRKASGAAIPLPDGTVDLSFMSCVLHHIPEADRRPVVAEMGRVTRPGGIVTIFEHNPWNWLTRFIVSLCPFDRGLRLIPSTETARLMESAGLRVFKTGYMIFLPTFIENKLGWDRSMEHCPVGAQYFVAAHRV